MTTADEPEGHVDSVGNRITNSNVQGDVYQVGVVHVHQRRKPRRLLPEPWKRRSGVVAAALSLFLFNTSSSAGFGEAGGAFVTANPIGRSLVINLQSLHGLTGGFVFPAAEQQKAQRYEVLAETQGVSDKLFMEALRDGAYLVGGARLTFEMTSAHDRPVRITKVRALAEPESVVTGTVFRGGGHGSGALPTELSAERAGVLLDSPARDAHVIADDGSLYPGPYLDRRNVPVGEGLSPRFTIEVNARERAYRFKVEIQYYDNGSRLSQVVDLDGSPLHATADLCLTRRQRYLTPIDAGQDLAARRYLRVVIPDKRPGANPGGYTVQEPEEFAQKCFAS